MWVVGEGSHQVSGVYVCASVSVVVTPPSPSSHSLSLSCFPSLLTSSSSPLCVSCSALALCRQRRAPAPPLHGWRILPHLSHQHALCAATVQYGNHTVILPPFRAGKWSLSVLQTLSLFKLTWLLWMWGVNVSYRFYPIKFRRGLLMPIQNQLSIQMSIRSWVNLAFSNWSAIGILADLLNWSFALAVIEQIIVNLMIKQ